MMLKHDSGAAPYQSILHTSAYEIMFVRQCEWSCYTYLLEGSNAWYLDIGLLELASYVDCHRDV